MVGSEIGRALTGLTGVVCGDLRSTEIRDSGIRSPGQSSRAMRIGCVGILTCFARIVSGTPLD